MSTTTAINATDPNATSFSGDSNLDDFANYTAPNSGDAWAYLSSVLSYYGLSSLDSSAQQWVQQGLSNAEIVQSIRQTPTYKQVFAPIVERQQLGLPPISESDVINLRQSYSQIDQQMGAPEGFNGTQDYDQFIVNDMSPTEYQDRWQNAYLKISQADPATQQALQDFYGVTPGQYAAWALDPTKAESAILKQFTSAQIGGAAQNTGYGSISQQQAAYLQSLGITQSQALQGFNQLGLQQQLFNPLPGVNESSISQDQQIGAQFDQNAQDQLAITNKANQRKADFEGGGNYNPAQPGSIGGAGTAQ